MRSLFLMVTTSADSCMASTSWMREDSWFILFCILWRSAIWWLGLCYLSLLCEMLQFIFAEYMLSFERIFFGWVPEQRKVSWKLGRRVRLRESSGERQVWIEEDTSVQLRSVS